MPSFWSPNVAPSDRTCDGQLDAAYRLAVLSVFRHEALNISDRSTRASWVFSYGVVDGGHRYAFFVASSAEFALAAV